MGILSLLNQNIDARIGGTMLQEEFEGIIRYQIINAVENMDSGMMPAFTEYHIKGKDISIQMIGADDTKMARILIDGDD